MPRRVRVLGDLFHGQIPDGAVYIGRRAPGLPQSPFHNPFRVDTPGCATAADAVAAYQRWLAYGVVPNPKPSNADQLDAIRDEALRRIKAGELTGRDLACWCREDSPCHGDVLLSAVQEITGGAR